jgi:arylsulfatase A-like enzyme
MRTLRAAVPNVLLIVVDCLRADMLARGRRAWPRMSALAAGGARFTACYSTCPTTTPAVTAILTGRYPSTHGVQGLRGTQLSESVPTAAEQLGRAGAATWCSATGPLLDTVGSFRGFAEAEYRDVPRRSVHSDWGPEGIARIARLAAGERPFFALVHLWDATRRAPIRRGSSTAATAATPTSAPSRAWTRGSARRSTPPARTPSSC